MTSQARAADFFRLSATPRQHDLDDRDVRATCGPCRHELTLDEAAVEIVGSTTHYACPRCSAALLVVAPIPGEAGLVGIRTLDGARAWLSSSAGRRVSGAENLDDDTQ